MGFYLFFSLFFTYKDTYLINVTASVNKPVESDDESLNYVSTTEREDDLAKRTKEE